MDMTNQNTKNFLQRKMDFLILSQPFRCARIREENFFSNCQHRGRKIYWTAQKNISSETRQIIKESASGFERAKKKSKKIFGGVKTLHKQNIILVDDFTGQAFGWGKDSKPSISDKMKFPLPLLPPFPPFFINRNGDFRAAGKLLSISVIETFDERNKETTSCLKNRQFLLPEI